MWKTLLLTPRKLLPNSIRYYRTSTAPYTNETGLYGFDQLKSSQGFQRFVDDAIERSGELINYISGMPSPPDIIKAMDEISDTVCCVVDSAELCRHTHPDREFVEEANKASMRINDYLHYLNTNHTLYNAVMKSKQDGYMLSEEAKRAAQYLCMDFEKGGIHLCAEKLERVNQLNINISQLFREFNENIATDPGFVDIFPASRVPRQLHNLLKPIYRSTNKSRVVLSSRDNQNEKGFRISTEQGLLTSVLHTASDDEVRKLAYIKGNSVPQSNLAVLDKLIRARHEMSQMTAVIGV